MKSLLSIFALLLSVLPLHADYTARVTVKTDDGDEVHQRRVVYFFQPQRARAEVPDEHGSMTIHLVDYEKKTRTKLYDAPASAWRETFEELEKDKVKAREWRRDLYASAHKTDEAESPMPKPKATGKKAKIGPWETEIFEAWMGKRRLRYWVAKNVPSFQAIAREFSRLDDLIEQGDDPVSSLPDDLGGLIVQAEYKTPSDPKNARPGMLLTLTELVDGPVDDARFKIPNEYDRHEPKFTLDEVIDTPRLKGKVTLRIDDQQLRVDLPAAEGGGATGTLVADLLTRQITALDPAAKRATNSSFAAYRKAHAPALADAPKFAKPTATGAKEKVGEWDTAVFESGQGEAKLRLWVASDFLQAKDLPEYFRQWTAGTGATFNAYQWDLGGMVVKWELHLPGGEQHTATLTQAEEGPLDAATFSVPADYEKVVLPAEKGSGEYVIEAINRDDDFLGKKLGAAVIRIKGNRFQRSATNAYWTELLDLDKGEYTRFDHLDKHIDVMKVEERRKDVQSKYKVDATKQPRPAATGEKEKIGEWETEIFQTTANGVPVRLWVAQGIPKYNLVRAKLAEFYALAEQHYNPHQLDLGGLVVKMEPSDRMVGHGFTMTRIAEEAVEDAAFDFPVGYVRRFEYLPGSAAPADDIVLKEATLGNFKGRKLEVSVYLSPEAAGEESGALHVSFGISEGPEPKGPLSVWMGNAFKNSTTVEVFRPAGYPRALVLVSAPYGGVYSRVFDYDGKSVRLLYEETGSRTYVSLGKDKAGNFQIVETWRKDWFSDSDNLGVGHERSDGAVERVVKWNGRQFKPDTGPTRVVKYRGDKKPPEP